MSKNPAASGQYFDENFILSRKDKNILDNNIKKISDTIIPLINDLGTDIKEHISSLMNQNGVQLKHKWEAFKLAYYNTQLEFIDKLTEKLNETCQYLKEKLERVQRLFSLSSNQIVKQENIRSKRRKKENRRKSRQRFLCRLKKGAIDVLKLITKNKSWTIESVYKLADSKSIEDIITDDISTFSKPQGMYLGYLMKFNLFPHIIKCLIVDELPKAAADGYSATQEQSTSFYASKGWAFESVLISQDESSLNDDDDNNDHDSDDDDHDDHDMDDNDHDDHDMDDNDNVGDDTDND